MIIFDLSSKCSKILSMVPVCFFFSFVCDKYFCLFLFICVCVFVCFKTYNSTFVWIDPKFFKSCVVFDSVGKWRQLITQLISFHIQWRKLKHKRTKHQKCTSLSFPFFRFLFFFLFSFSFSFLSLYRSILFQRGAKNWIKFSWDTKLEEWNVEFLDERFLIH